jgi:hypothetical protein
LSDITVCFARQEQMQESAPVGKHRRRAAIGRGFWGEIGEAARGTLGRKLKRTPQPGRLAPSQTEHA